MSDQEAQDEEILALKSIYESEEELLKYDQEAKKGVFYAKINTNQPFKLNFVNEKKIITVEHLPPIVLTFEYPVDYPSVNAPKYTLACRWLSLKQIQELCKNLDDLWERNSNCPILFTWIYFLMDESIDYLKLTDDEIQINTKDTNCSTDERAICEPCSVNLMQDYDKNESDLKFQQGYYNCNVCISEKSGADCMRFIPCQHVYCNDCMKEYFEVQINEGKVYSLTCPFEKCESQALPLQVLKLLNADLYKKYDALLLRNSLNSMTDILYCPRVHCQSPIIPDENMALCPSCQYAFCVLCRQGFHGIEPCKLSNVELKKICNQYRNGDDEVRAKLAKRYGANRIKKALEESDSMELIERTSKQCPKCKSWMQKLDGCNKMTCTKCRSYFCWLCMCILQKSDPYAHFNSTNSKCFNKLFEGIIHTQEDDNNEDSEDDDDNEHVAVAGAGAVAAAVRNVDDEAALAVFANFLNDDDEGELYYPGKDDDDEYEDYDDDDDDDYEDDDDEEDDD